MLGISILGLLRNLPRLLREPDLKEFQSGLAMVGLGVIVTIVLIVGAKLSGVSSG